MCELLADKNRCLILEETIITCFTVRRQKGNIPPPPCVWYFAVAHNANFYVES